MICSSEKRFVMSVLRFMNGPDQVLHGTEIGEQVRPNKLSMHKVKLAMAIRTKNADWRMKDIQPRHWMEIGKRYGVLDDRGRTAEVLIDEVMAGLEPAIAKVQACRLASRNTWPRPSSTVFAKRPGNSRHEAGAG